MIMKNMIFISMINISGIMPSTLSLQRKLVFISVKQIVMLKK